MNPALLSLFAVEHREYTHFSVNEQTLTLLIYALCAGVLLAAAYALYQKNVPGAVVRRVIAADALSESTAKTATELGIGARSLLYAELRRNPTLKRLIRRVEPGEATAGGAETRYFIPEEEKYRAQVRYENAGNGPFGFFLTVALTVVLALLLLRLLPVFLTVVDKIL